MTEPMTEAMETVYQLQEEVRRLRRARATLMEENRQCRDALDDDVDLFDEVVKLRKVVDAAKEFEEALWTVLDPTVHEFIKAEHMNLQTALRAVGDTRSSA